MPLDTRCWILFGLMLFALMSTVGCVLYPPPIIVPGAGSATFRLTATKAQPVTVIPMSGPLSAPQAQLSGLAWYGDMLILLPQFPESFGNQLFALSQREIVAYLVGETAAPLTPFPIPINDQALREQLIGWEGYEAIVFSADRAYVTIETRRLAGMLGYVVGGEMAPDLTGLRLDPTHLTPITPQVALNNMSDESIVLIDNQVATIFEANGLLVNPEPVLHLYDATSLTPIGMTPFPNIEYRITDATELDDNGRFWALNYFSPSAPSLRNFLRSRGALDAFNAQAQPIERLLEFRVTPQGIIRTASPPLALELLPDGGPNGWLARNWEGVVRLQTPELNGFLIVTDTFPSTILAYVPMP